MKRREKKAFIPVERHETIRQGIMSILTNNTMSSKEISGRISIPEKEVYEHLEHIQKSLGKEDSELVITPAECLKCGFVFKKRERFKKPGRCPVCRNEQIAEPFFSIRVNRK